MAIVCDAYIPSGMTAWEYKTINLCFNLTNMAMTLMIMIFYFLPSKRKQLSSKAKLYLAAARLTIHFGDKVLY